MCARRGSSRMSILNDSAETLTNEPCAAKFRSSHAPDPEDTTSGGGRVGSRPGPGHPIRRGDARPRARLGHSRHNHRQGTGTALCERLGVCADEPRARSLRLASRLPLCATQGLARRHPSRELGLWLRSSSEDEHATHQQSQAYRVGTLLRRAEAAKLIEEDRAAERVALPRGTGTERASHH